MESKSLTDEYIIENNYWLKFDDEFINSIDFYFVRAVEGLNVELASLLLPLGADPNVNGSDGVESVLHGLCHEYSACRTLKGNLVLEMGRLLLENGADPDIAGCNNLTPVQVCRSSRARPMEELLLAFGANPEGNEVV